MKNPRTTKIFPSFTTNTLDEGGNLLYRSGDQIVDGVCCIRPSLKQMTPRVDTIKLDEQLVFNNYGHSGLGWSLFWGTVLDSYSQFVKATGKLPKDTPITILGCGVVGGGTFLKLLQEGFTNITVISKDWKNSTSWGAGAILSLTPRDLPYTKEEQRRVNDYFLETFIEAQSIIEGNSLFPNKNNGVRRTKGYFGTDADDSYETYEGLDILVQEGLVAKPTIEEVNFGQIIRKMSVADVIWYNPYSFMTELHEMMRKYATCVEQDITDIEEIDTDIVFNCMGLGGSILTQDGLAKPTCGHILKLKDCFFDGIIMAEMNLDGEKRLFYYFPKTDGSTFNGVFGGTFCEGYDGKDEERNYREFKAMYETAKQFFGRRRVKVLRQ